MAEDDNPPVLLSNMLTLVLQIAMVLGPSAAYIDQYTTMRRTGSARGFSNIICGVLLVANIIRVFFWFGRQFDVTLLWQSLLMIATQLGLLQLCLRCRAFDDPNGSWLYERSIWRWPEFSDYLTFLAQLSTGLALMHVMAGQQDWYIETIGFLAVGIEAMLPVPQALSNYQRQSVEGFSPVVLLSWLGGDLFKTGYYYATGAPMQFLICGVFQLMIDFVILGQTAMYGNSFRTFKLSRDGHGTHVRLSDNESERRKAMSSDHV